MFASKHTGISLTVPYFLPYTLTCCPCTRIWDCCSPYENLWHVNAWDVFPKVTIISQRHFAHKLVVHILFRNCLHELCQQCMRERNFDEVKSCKQLTAYFLCTCPDKPHYRYCRPVGPSVYSLRVFARKKSQRSRLLNVKIQTYALSGKIATSVVTQFTVNA